MHQQQLLLSTVVEAASLQLLLLLSTVEVASLEARPAEGELQFHNAGTPPNISHSYDCESRRHAWRFAQATLPQRGDFRSAFDALQLQACGLMPPERWDEYVPPKLPTPRVGTLLFAAPAATASGDGSKQNPLSLRAAVAAAAAAEKPVVLLLRKGVYHLARSLQLGPAHSNLTIQNYQGEEVAISGAVPVRVASKSAWKLVNGSTNTWQLDVHGQKLFPSYGLRVGTQRAVLAKFPNGDPALSAVHMDSGSIPYGPGRYLNGSGRSMRIPTYFSREHAPVNTTIEYWARPADWPGVYWHEFSTATHAPMDGAGGYGAWFHAEGGICSGRQVPYGYWCSADAPRSGGGKLQPPYNPPGGFLYASNNSLPQAASYRNASGAVFHARGGTNPYFSYMCLVDSINVTSGTVHFDPTVGCDQGGPTTKSGAAWDWFIEGVLEECDSPGEYFLDERTEQLYYTFNSSASPTGNEIMSVTRAKVLLNITGTQERPVRDITITGITFRDAAMTFLGTTEADKHYLPSSGDWALQRSGAITLAGVENVSIAENQFTRCDGNAISLNDYARDVSFIGNDFNWIGESAMTAFGSTSECVNANCSVKLPAAVGPDGRGGNQPRGTRVVGNVVREFGIWQKQSSAWAQQLTAESWIEGNVIFNSPRAAINFW